VELRGDVFVRGAWKVTACWRGHFERNRNVTTAYAAGIASVSVASVARMCVSFPQG
jgi:hypothetical protein